MNYLIKLEIKMKYSMHFRPHIGNCSKDFVIESENLAFLRYQSSLLIALQSFLTVNNHSAIKAHLEFQDENGKMSQSNQIVESINNNLLYGFSEQKTSSFNVSKFKNSGVGFFYYFPQVPCKSFIYPFAIADKAAISNLIYKYNNYLLENNLRADYSDMLCFSFFDPLAKEYIEKEYVKSEVDLWYSDIDDSLIRMMLDDDATDDDELEEIVTQMNDCYDEIRESTEFESIKIPVTVEILKNYKLSFYKHF